MGNMSQRERERERARERKAVLCDQTAVHMMTPQISSKHQHKPT
jgi:hypothetical protein